MIKIKYNETTIKEKRAAVAERLLKESPNINSGVISCISFLDLQILYLSYDEIFFDNWFKKNFEGYMLYELSRRMTVSAGITKCPKNISQLNPERVKIRICIGIDFFFRYNQLAAINDVCGIRTSSALEALQIVFEHELIHALEFLLYYKSNCSQERFRVAAGNLFGHTHSHHLLPTNHKIASEIHGIRLGDMVQFEFDGKPLIGVVNKIGKRATVMVKNPNGNYTNNNDEKHLKYYVPLSLLIKT